MLGKDRRLHFLKECHALYRPYFEALCQLLPSQWQPYCVYRSPQEQEALYAQGRATSGRIVTRARAWESPHQYRMASDWTIFEGTDPEWPHASDAIWGEYLHACLKAGVETLGFERPHNEIPLSIDWKQVSREYGNGGLPQAIELIGKFTKGRK